jgi:DNA polymerase I-like protein with 3'-5' exonuclease and polymerase domains
MIDFDVETTGLQPWSQSHYAFMFQFLDDEGNSAVLEWSPDDDSNRAEIQQWFDRARGQGLRAWNSKFDLAFGEAAGFELPPEEDWHDGMLEAFAINERRSVALKAVADEVLGAGSSDLQKEVKTWLNDEAKRRRKLVKDADKALAVPEDERTVEHLTLIADAAEYRADDGTTIMPNFSDVERNLMRKYGLEDVVLTRGVCNSHEVVFANDPDLRKVVEFERKTMGALYAIEKSGLPANRDSYMRLEKEVIENLELLEDRVMELVREGDPTIYAQQLKKHVETSEDGSFVSVESGGSLDEFSPRSSGNVHAALLARDADLSFMSEKDGKLPMDADNLRAVHDELAAAILNFRAEEKVLSTYVRPMIGRSYEAGIRAWKEPFIAPDGRIHANYRQVGARTGRMSCSDPNMQNQPRDDLRLRYNIEAEPGHVLVTCDLTNIEMVLFAAYCGEGKLLEAVQKGEDLHVLTAKMVGLRDRARPGGGIETARQQGKVYNFTIIYGGGLRSIRRYFRVSMDEARKMKALYNRAYPEVGRLQARIDYKLQDNGYIEDKLISGRRFRVDWQKESYKATNYLIQGTAASILKQAVIDLHADGVPMNALVHDEIVAHVPISDAVEVAHLIEKRMTAAAAPGGPLWIEGKQAPLVPLRAEADIVHRWSDAKPLKDKDGREYYFDPVWANLERTRWVDEQKPLVKR